MPPATTPAPPPTSAAPNSASASSLPVMRHLRGHPVGRTGAPVVTLPGVLHRVGDDLLAVRRHLDLEVDRARVDLLELVALRGDLPVGPAVEDLLHDHL